MKAQPKWKQHFQSDRNRNTWDVFNLTQSFMPAIGFSIYLFALAIMLVSCNNDVLVPDTDSSTELRSKTPPTVFDKKVIHNANGVAETGSGIGILLSDNGGTDPKHKEFADASIVNIDDLPPSNFSMVNSTILVGDGLEDYTEGMARDAGLFTVAQTRGFQDIEALTDAYPRIYVAVHPYESSLDPNSGQYTSLSQAVDQKANARPQVLHVWGAGNKVTMMHQYASAKNVLTTGKCTWNDDADMVTRDGGSFGTSFGILKPEIMALDFHRGAGAKKEYVYGGGSGHSASVVAGAAAIVKQALLSRTQSGGEVQSALLKNLLCNGADLMGNPQKPYPRRTDKRWGFGSLNVQRSVTMAENSNWRSFTVTTRSRINTNLKEQGASFGRYKVMLNWLDPVSETQTADPFANRILLVVNGKEAAPFSNIQQVVDVRPTDKIEIIMLDESIDLTQQVFLSWCQLSADELIDR